MFIFKKAESLRCSKVDRKGPIEKDQKRKEIINIVKSQKGAGLALERRGTSFLLKHK